MKDLQIEIMNKPTCDCAGGELAENAHFASCQFLSALTLEELTLINHA